MLPEQTCFIGVVAKVFVVPEMNIICVCGGGGGVQAKITCRPTLYILLRSIYMYFKYMHAIFVIQHSKLHSFQGGGSEYEMNDVRFRDDKKTFVTTSYFAIRMY